MDIICIILMSLSILILLIAILELIIYGINLKLYEIKLKCLYKKHNYEKLQKLTRLQYCVNLHYPKISFRCGFVLYIIIISLYLFLYYKDFIVDFLGFININIIKEWLIQFNNLISKYNYIFLITITVIVFAISFIAYSNHKSKFSNAINDFQGDKLRIILEYHSKIIYPISDIIYKNNENLKQILESMYKNNRVNINYIAKTIIENNFPEIEINVFSGEPIVEKRKLCSTVNQNNFVSEDMSAEIKKLSELIIEFYKKETFYSPNVFSHLNEKFYLPYPLSFYEENIDKLIKSLYSELATNKYFEGYKENPKYFSEDSLEMHSESIIKLYKETKRSIEQFALSSMKFTIELEKYSKGLSKTLNIKQRNVKKALSDALEKSK